MKNILTLERALKHTIEAIVIEIIHAIPVRLGGGGGGGLQAGERYCKKCNN